MSSSPSTLAKRPYLALAGFVVLGALLFGVTLQALMRLQAREATPALVFDDLSDEPASLELDPFSLAQAVESEGYRTVRVSVVARVTEDGGSTEIGVSEEACEPDNLQSVRKLGRQGPVETIGLQAKRVVCLKVAANSILPKPTSLTGTWYSVATPVPPDFDGSAKRWVYQSVDGSLRALDATALGYCADAEGACYGSVAIDEGLASARPYALIRISGYNVATVTLK